ncbi:hypothetical protein FB384_004910 [Prauserella sediminis]|uniref:Uncharacterized protein n=1 Tax=Prauserella sediminis TaxID=577680 RepID=A0A839XTC2_9PSEU|nr:hypothetical protein [Prauserella sediminis]MBB3665951.1 hypothetical protein [Prauserella sediminis]
MFQGTIPAEMRSIVAEHARSWPDGDVYIGCSGNLTIERTLAAQGRFRLHSNDVNAYSCALGWYYSGQPLPFRVADDSRDELDWLDQYLDDGAGTLATLMIGTRFLQFVGKTGRYHQRMVQAHRDQFDRMHADTVAKIEATTLQLASFTAGDVLDYLRDDVPREAPFASFPPFDAGGYEAMFAGITNHFDWPTPVYEEFGEDGRDEMISLITDRPNWILGLLNEAPELEEHRVGYVQVGPRARPFWVYAQPGRHRWVGPRQKVEPVLMPRLGPGEEIGDDLTLHPLSGGQFNSLRSAYLARGIAPGQPLFSCAVSSGGRIIGAFGYLPPKFGLDAYLMSDFSVAPTSYKRLSKLIVMAAISSEAQTLVQRALSKRVTTWSTTAFTNNPTSGKYGRGVPGIKLHSRKPCDDEHYAYQLQYGGPLGQWTLAEALEMWKAKHAQVAA